MAEAANPKHGEAHDEHAPFSPEDHIKDKVLIGLDAKTGQWVRAYDAHGHLKKEFAGYAPAKVGPFKVEFTKHMGVITLVAALIFVAGMLVAARVRAALHNRRAPEGRLANMVEAIVMFIRDEIVAPMGGHHLGHYTPLFITYFLFILSCNLLGMVPEVGTATGNISVTAGLAITVYALIWILGMYNQGPINFVVHLVPPGTPFWLWPLMFVLELLGPIIKCFVLAVRLFANMIAGHLIIGNILSLGVIGGLVPTSTAIIMLGIGVPLSLGLSLLEIMVCFIQAYVFTLLSVIFIGAAVHPEH